MPTLIEQNHTGEFLLSEANGELSREVVTLAATDAALVSGTVLGVVTVGGNYAPYDAEAEDGTETAKAVLYSPAGASSGTQKVTVIVRDAEVAQARLTGYDADAKAGLAATGIIVR